MMRLVNERLLRWLALFALAATACDDPTGPERPPLTDLPPDLAAVTFTATGRPSFPYTMLELRHAQGFRGFVAVNGAGQPVWFFRTVGGPFGTARRQNGNFVFMDSNRGLVEVTPDGAEVRELAQQPRPGRFMHHDVTASPRNTIFFIAEDVRAGRDSTVTGDALWEWNPETGSVARRWSSFDQLDPALDWGARSVNRDWVHANALFASARGNVLISMHFLDQVASIAPDFSRLEWRLGGVRATITVDDPFSGQHTAAELEPGRVLVFDNGFARETERYSRAAEYVLGQATAQKVWQWRPERDNWARVISSARRLPNGNTLVGFGTQSDPALGSTGPIEVYEVTRQGTVVWHLTIGGTVSSMYRATPLPDF
jgi:hypothetical protein